MMLSTTLLAVAAMLGSTHVYASPTPADEASTASTQPSSHIPTTVFDPPLRVTFFGEKGDVIIAKSSVEGKESDNEPSGSMTSDVLESGAVALGAFEFKDSTPFSPLQDFDFRHKDKFWNCSYRVLNDHHVRNLYYDLNAPGDSWKIPTVGPKNDGDPEPAASFDDIEFFCSPEA